MKDKSPGRQGKHLSLRNAILDGIRKGEFAAGGRLPSERDLAERYDVSYMTARRAVETMVDDDVLERRGRSGTFVRASESEQNALRTIHLLCPAWDNSIARSFLYYGSQYLTEQEWNPVITYLRPGDETEAARVIESGAPVIMLPHGDAIKPSLLKALQGASDRAVVLARRLDHLGIPSVLADDAHAVRMGVAHLREQGHWNIGLVIDHTDDPIQRVQVATWHSALAVETAGATEAQPTMVHDNLLVKVELPYFGNLAACAYETVCAYLASPASSGVTALLCIGEEIALATVGACRDSAQPTPEKISVVQVGHSRLMGLITPPVTSVELSIAQHVGIAFEMLRQRMEGAVNPPLLRFVEPKLIVRQSVRALPPNGNGDV